MDISSLSGILSTDYMDAVAQKTLLADELPENFDSVLASAMNVLNETNALQNDAQAQKMRFALGEADNPHDMQNRGCKGDTGAAVYGCGSG